MKKVPLVSVLMPVYNGEKYLVEAVQSILNQSITDFELLLINDGSTDGTDDIVNTFTDKRIVKINNIQNRGLIFSLNRGISLAQGKYIARMDADDISMPSRLEKQISFLELHHEIGFCGTWAFKIDGKGGKIGVIRKVTDYRALKISLLFSSPYLHPSMVIRTELLKHNHYNEAYKHIEDFELWIRLSKISKGANLPLYLLHYRWHGNNISILENSEQERLKEQIVKKELVELGLKASNDDYLTHVSTFQLKQVKLDFIKIKLWFKRLLEANQVKKYYDQNVLKAFLWSRWIIAVILSGQYCQLMKFGFPYSLKVLFHTLRILKEKK